MDKPYEIVGEPERPYLKAKKEKKAEEVEEKKPEEKKGEEIGRAHV
mgnify:CR=1 FL=1